MNLCREICVDDHSADILTYIKKANCLLLSSLWPQTLHLCRSFVASLAPPLVDRKMVLRLTPEVIEFDSMRHHGGSIFERHPGVNCGAYCGVHCGAAAGGKKQEFTIFESPPLLSLCRSQLSLSLSCGPCCCHSATTVILLAPAPSLEGFRKLCNPVHGAFCVQKAVHSAETYFRAQQSAPRWWSIFGCGRC